MRRRSRPPNVYLHRPAASYHFALTDPPTQPPELVSSILVAQTEADYKPFVELTDPEKDEGWTAFNEFCGRYRR